jgi:hypothetical protein
MGIERLKRKARVGCRRQMNNPGEGLSVWFLAYSFTAPVSDET